MQIEKLTVGPYGTNCYLVAGSQASWIIDPGFEGPQLVSWVKTSKLALTGIVLTHTHWDHVMALPQLRAEWPELPIYVHQEDAQFLGAEGGQAMAEIAKRFDPFHGRSFQKYLENLPEATHFLTEESPLPVDDNNSLQVLHTPGHSPGSICLYSHTKQVLFAGDTLFFRGVGRTDIPFGNTAQLNNSLHTKLFTLPKETLVLPGHGQSTTIGDEKTP